MARRNNRGRVARPDPAERGEEMEMEEVMKKPL
jgi:hypothetical protein